MHRLTTNYECWVTKDGSHFVLHNISENSADAYPLGEFAQFEDEGRKYKTTIGADQIYQLIEITS